MFWGQWLEIRVGEKFPFIKCYIVSIALESFDLVFFFLAGWMGFEDEVLCFAFPGNVVGDKFALEVPFFSSWFDYHFLRIHVWCVWLQPLWYLRQVSHFRHTSEAVIADLFFFCLDSFKISIDVPRALWGPCQNPPMALGDPGANQQNF